MDQLAEPRLGEAAEAQMFTWIRHCGEPEKQLVFSAGDHRWR
jgi:hypothetical protein